MGSRSVPSQSQKPDRTVGRSSYMLHGDWLKDMQIIASLKFLERAYDSDVVECLRRNCQECRTLIPGGTMECDVHTVGVNKNSNFLGRGMFFPRTVGQAELGAVIPDDVESGVSDKIIFEARQGAGWDRLIEVGREFDAHVRAVKGINRVHAQL